MSRLSRLSQGSKGLFRDVKKQILHSSNFSSARFANFHLGLAAGFVIKSYGDCDISYVLADRLFDLVKKKYEVKRPLSFLVSAESKIKESEELTLFIEQRFEGKVGV